MAKKKSAAKGEPQDGEGAKATPNGYDSDAVEAVVDEIETLQGRIDEIMQEAKDKCAPIADDIKAVKKAANEDHGIPRKEFNALLSKRRFLRKAENADAALSDEQKVQFDLLQQSLGMLSDTPLGRAAMTAH